MKKFISHAWLMWFVLTLPALMYSNGIVFQVATIGSLYQGVYDSNYSYGELMKHGDFGLGTFLDLNGEMMALDGHFYQMEVKGEPPGKLKLVSAKQMTPFAQITFFKPTIHKTLGSISNFQEVENILDILPNKDIPYAIRIDGLFKSVNLRSVRKQMKPYRPLVQVVKDGVKYDLQDVKGSLIGFWFPKYWAGIASPAFHFHFVTADHSIGGHVLDFNLKEGQLSIEPLHQIQVYLPNKGIFVNETLSARCAELPMKNCQ